MVGGEVVVHLVIADGGGGGGGGGDGALRGRDLAGSRFGSVLV